MSHYFSTTPSGPDRRREIDVALRGRRVRLETAAGVFSGDRLDPGTTVLLDTVDDPPATGTLLDLGCGWGPIAIAMALASPGARVLAVDVNERALALTADNAARLGLENVQTYLPEELLATEPDLRVDELWSNPPIRIGKAALHEILRTWLPRLTPGARAQLVVQRNLGSDSLQRWIAAELDRDVTRLTSVNGFRVLTVH
ncbi:class I SAM-dependent methyltransferase [Occultella kanbiaonis]|uniref:class I SAM-dependent methyltransferase n=1 Tax=Occultella kanbiaonis TaxID=2675754 RepID=UPI001E5A0F5C|nr:methyltransferase [Occultella kanbiaonis]